LEWNANGLHVVQLSCFVKIQNGSAFLLPTYTGCPGKKSIKWGFLLLFINNYHSSFYA